MPETLQFVDRHPRARPACINELSIRCEVAEQQRPDAMSAALGITVSYDDEFLPVEAFCFQPCTPVRLVAAIDSLGDDALKTAFAGQPVELRAMPDLVIVVSQPIRRTV